MREKDKQVLEALTQAKEEYEDLAALLDFCRALAEVQFETRARISADVDVHDEAYMQQRLRDGMPQLTFDQLGVDPAVFAHLVRQVMDILVRHSPDWAALAEPEKDIETGELMRLARESFEGKAQLAQAELSWSGMIALAVGLALVPYVERAAERLQPCMDQSHWQRGYCPLCGAAPDLALLDEESGARHLVCCRCSSRWRYVRLKCPFCGTTDHTKLRYYLSDDEAYRLYVCELCKHYLKAIDLRTVQREMCLPVERIVTISMDVAAQEQGYVSWQEPVLAT